MGEGGVVDPPPRFAINHNLENDMDIVIALPRTTHDRLGDALNAITDFAKVTPEGEEPVNLYPLEPEQEFKARFIPDDTKAIIGVYEVGCYAVIGYICAWRMNDNRVLYTAHEA